MLSPGNGSGGRSGNGGGSRKDYNNSNPKGGGLSYQQQRTLDKADKARKTKERRRDAEQTAKIW